MGLSEWHEAACLLISNLGWPAWTIIKTRKHCLLSELGSTVRPAQWLRNARLPRIGIFCSLIIPKGVWCAECLWTGAALGAADRLAPVGIMQHISRGLTIRRPVTGAKDGRAA
jgi:hypothetical protein